MPTPPRPDQTEAPAPAPKAVAAEQKTPPVTVTEDRFEELKQEEHIEPDQGSSTRPYVTTGPTVTVACKLPNGLILQLCTMEDVREQVMGGGVRIVKMARRLPQTFRLNGAAQRHGEGAVPTLTFGGYAMTYGIPEDFWERWVEQNADSDIVQKRQVYAMPGVTDAKREGKSLANNISGFEPVDPTKKMKMGAFSVEEAERT